MNSWNPYRLATLFVAVVALVFSLAITPAQAHHCKGGHFDPDTCPPPPGGGGDPVPQECNLEFQGTFADDVSDRVRSDNGDPYINDVENVQFTSGTLENQGMLRGMLRFDTNGSARVEKRQDIRKATLDFTAAIASHSRVYAEVGFSSDLKGIDLRFDFTDGVGLNVCELEVVADLDNPVEARPVVINIVFLTGDGEDYALSYGCRAYPGAEPEDFDASKAVVTRTGTSTYTIEGTWACLRDGPGAYYPRIDLNGGGFDPGDDQILMPFLITLTDLNAP